MADDAERRYRAAFDKLFLPSRSPSEEIGSQGKNMQSETPLSSGLRQATRFLLSRRPDSTKRGGEGAKKTSSPTPKCRPWDRGDLMKRLSTFKSLTWFGKPKVVSPVNCARRGWVNVGPDALECEACGNRLFFCTPTSWNVQQVEKAAAVFSIKLDNEHKQICPWKDNICDEKLVEFPPTPVPVLVETFNDRWMALAQLSALPIVSSSAIERHKGPQLDWFLELYRNSLFSKDGANLLQSKDLEDTSSGSTKNYQTALKIISLFGWEPHILPYMVNCEVDNQDAEESNIPVSVENNFGGRSSNVLLSSFLVDTISEKNDGSSRIGAREPDPAAVVLDCKICGARAGLWAFLSVSRHLQLFWMSESPENTSRCSPSGVIRYLGGESTSDHVEAETVDSGTNAIAHDDRRMNLRLTIAGGPPATQQNFRPTVTLPIISRRLPAEILSDSEVKKNISGEVHRHIIETLDNSLGHVEDQPDLHGDFDVSSAGCITARTLKRKIIDVGGLSDKVLDAELSLEQDSTLTEERSKDDKRSGDSNTGQTVSVSPPLEELQRHTRSQIGESTPCRPRVDQMQKHSQATLTSGADSQLDKAVLEGQHLEGKKAEAISWKKTEFDPIQQHRHFCPWITSSGKTNKGLAGWQLTLNALQQGDSSTCQVSSAISSHVMSEGSNPLALVRKLFESGSVKRVKRD